MPKPSLAITKITIRKKLLAVSLALLLVPIGVLGFVAYQVSKDETNALIEKNVKNSVKMAIEMMASFDGSVKEGLMTMEEAQERFKVLLIGPQQGGKRAITNKTDLGPNGYFFVLDEKGNLLAHPNLEGQNIWDKKTSDGQYYIQDMIKKALNGGGFTYYNWPLPDSQDEELKVTYAEKSPYWGWIIAAGSYMQDYNGGQKNILYTIVYTFLACLILGIAAVTLFARHISSPLIRMAQDAERIAQGDLTLSDLAVKNKDEIGQLAAAFNQMNRNLKQLVAQLTDNAASLSDSSRHLSAAIGQTSEATNQISAAILEAADNNEAQAQSVKETSKATEEMAAGIQRIASISTNAYQASENTLEQAEHGHRLIERSIGEMTELHQTIGHLATVVSKLRERSRQIGEIAQAMAEISKQTHLLALNASIEASHAGEQGKGFAVVAHEVRKLAERSKQSASQVAELIEAIQTDIGVAAEAMDKGEKEVSVCLTDIRKTGDAFTNILEATRNVVHLVHETSAATEEMSASSEEIAALLKEMERVSSETASTTQEVSAAAGEQLENMKKIAVSAEELRQMSEEMKKTVQRFNIE